MLREDLVRTTFGRHLPRCTIFSPGRFLSERPHAGICKSQALGKLPSDQVVRSSCDVRLPCSICYRVTASHPGTPSLPDFFAFIWGKRTMTAPAGAGQPCAGGSRCVLSDSGWGCGRRRSPTRCLGTCREGPRGGALLRGAAAAVGRRSRRRSGSGPSLARWTLGKSRTLRSA